MLNKELSFEMEKVQEKVKELEEGNKNLKDMNESLNRKFKLFRKNDIVWSEELEEDNNCTKSPLLELIFI